MLRNKMGQEMPQSDRMGCDGVEMDAFFLAFAHLQVSVVPFLVDFFAQKCACDDAASPKKN